MRPQVRTTHNTVFEIMCRAARIELRERSGVLRPVAHSKGNRYLRNAVDIEIERRLRCSSVEYEDSTRGSSRNALLVPASRRRPLADFPLQERPLTTNVSGHFRCHRFIVGPHMAINP